MTQVHIVAVQQSRFNTVVASFLLGLGLLAGVAPGAESRPEYLAANKSAKLQQQAATYVGAQVCAACHPAAYALWQQSDHFMSMAVPGARTVKGDFAAQVEFHGIRTRFSRQGDKFLVNTLGAKQEQVFEVAYTFGHSPLQQYLIDVGGGRLQALNVAWDSRSPEVGGGRWFHLHPDEAINPGSPFFWTAHWQNWNSRCADCHSTAVAKHRDAATGQYRTEFAEVNLGCEACHGPGSQHVAAGGQGPILNWPNQLVWQFAPGQRIASPHGEASTQAMVNQCGACHSRRSAIAPQRPGGAYHDQFALALLDTGLYFPDGQIRDEVFVLGSFMQSKMFQAGVVCTDCHEPHSGKTLLKGNALCSQCHDPAAFDTPAHHFHPVSSAGADCLACHGQTRTFMQVDARRDHQFAIPHQGGAGSPSVCHHCHDEGLTFPSQVPALPGAFAQANHALASHHPNGAGLAVQFALDTGNPAIQRATLISQLGAALPEQLLAWSKEPSPLVRRAAATLAGRVGLKQAYAVLQSLSKDPMTSVRNEATKALAERAADLPRKAWPAFMTAVQAYRSSLALNADSPASLTDLAALEINLGRLPQARAAFEQALAIAPAFVPALLNFADMERAAGTEAAAAALLSRALKLAPHSADANFSQALSLVRQQQTQAALPHFAVAVQQEGSPPRYAYVYAVALDSLGRTPAAIETLQAASRRWPSQVDLLLLEALYRHKLADTQGLLPALKQLGQLAPSHPQVQTLLQRYAKEIKRQ